MFEKTKGSEEIKELTKSLLDGIDKKLLSKITKYQEPVMTNYQSNKTPTLESVEKVLLILSGYPYENAKYVLDVCQELINVTSEHVFPRINK